VVSGSASRSSATEPAISACAGAATSSVTARKRPTDSSRYSAGFHSESLRSNAIVSPAPTAVPIAATSAMTGSR